MDFKQLVNLAHDKGGHDELLHCMQWWLDNSDPALRKSIIAKFEHMAYQITPTEAEQIVKGMKPHGQYWNLKQIKDYLATKGITEHTTEYYLVMNMAYNDYYSTAKMYGLQNDAEFYYSLATNFIDDPDAKPFKIERYFSAT